MILALKMKLETIVDGNSERTAIRTFPTQTFLFLEDYILFCVFIFSYLIQEIKTSIKIFNK